MTGLNRLNIEQAHVNKAVDETEHGVTVKVMLSLFDVPKSASTDFIKDKNTIHFTFDYLGGEEQTIQTPSGPGIYLLLGRGSGRLYGIDVALDEIPEIDDSDAPYEFIIDIAEEGIKKYQTDNPKRRSRSLEAVDRVFKVYQQQLEPLVRQAKMAS